MNKITIKTNIQSIELANNFSFQICTPNLLTIQKEYEFRKQNNENTIFPFWAKVWDASIVMAKFLISNPNWIHQKKVIELAAGLGLPSLVAAKFAQSVICSDYVSDPFFYVEKSIHLHQIQNVCTQIIDCTNVPKELEGEVILMSDIQYSPFMFDGILKTIHHFLMKGAIIIITTPQRIMTKEFALSISDYIVFTEVHFLSTTEHDIQLWILQNH
ncbi:MAG: class I SAM-dependent methyltransferase [Chitinophagaceae bacterium]